MRTCFFIKYEREYFTLVDKCSMHNVKYVTSSVTVHEAAVWVQ